MRKPKKPKSEVQAVKRYNEKVLADNKKTLSSGGGRLELMKMPPLKAGTLGRYGQTSSKVQRKR